MPPPGVVQTIGRLVRRILGFLLLDRGVRVLDRSYVWKSTSAALCQLTVSATSPLIEVV